MVQNWSIPFSVFTDSFIAVTESTESLSNKSLLLPRYLLIIKRRLILGYWLCDNLKVQLVDVKEFSVTVAFYGS